MSKPPFAPRGFGIFDLGNFSFTSKRSTSREISFTSVGVDFFPLLSSSFLFSAFAAGAGPRR